MTEETKPEETKKPRKKRTPKPKPLDLRRSLFLARRHARDLVALWEELGADPKPVKALTFTVRAGLDKNDKARLTVWFPLMVSNIGKSFLYDLVVLRSILKWDDPLVMLPELVLDDRSWWAVLGDSQKRPCGKIEEDTIRRAYDQKMGFVSLFAKKDRNTDPHFPDSEHIKDFNLYQKNEDLRKITKKDIANKDVIGLDT